MRKLTIADIARMAGVSVSTASKALNGTDRVGKDTVERVVQIAQSLGYKPNHTARVLTGKKYRVGALLPKDPAVIYSLFVEGMRQTFAVYREYGYELTLRYYDRDADIAGFPRELQSFAAEIDGLIFIPGYHFDRYQDLIRELPMPAVSLQMDVEHNICPSVTVNETMVGRMAAELLVKTCGCQNTAIIAGNPESIIHRRNIQGFQEKLASYGMASAPVAGSFGDSDRAAACVDALLNADNHIDGIFVSSHVSPAVCAGIKRRGADHTVRVVGVDVYKETAKCLLAGNISALIYQNQKLQARQAVEKLFSLMLGGADGSGTSAKVKPEIVLTSNLEYFSGGDSDEIKAW